MTTVGHYSDIFEKNFLVWGNYEEIFLEMFDIFLCKILCFELGERNESLRLQYYPSGGGAKEPFTGLCLLLRDTL